MLGGPSGKKARLRYPRKNRKRTWAVLGCRTQESSYPEEWGSRVVTRVRGCYICWGVCRF